MKKILIFVSLAAIFASCSVTVPYAVTNNKIGNKVGTSETVCVFGAPIAPGPGGNLVATGSLVMNGNYGIEEAAKNGGITKIATVDVKFNTFLFFSKYKIIVTGE
ncbi:MAG: hypothetical protein C0596_18415 [Marinilabiliales bacterium]|nr:MAG: hypothetical protein C0596_18415 [Marinilabiliales bacterium]